MQAGIKHASGVGSRLFAFVVVAVVSGVLMAGLAVPVAAGAGVAVDAQARFLGQTPVAIEDLAVPTTSVMLAGDGSPIAYFYDEDRTEVPLARISPLMQDAVIAVEDARFYEHGGVDPRGVVRAFVNNVSGGSREGASTLTQQYVKNILLEQATAAGDTKAAQDAVAPTLERKVREMRQAIAMENRLTKTEILEGYLNTVFFGRQTYGVEAAARRYFGVTAADLSLVQAATLAGMVQDAAAYDPISRPAAAKERRDVVLSDLHDQGRITTAQYTAAVAGPVRTAPHPRPNGCTAATGVGFFCDYVLRSMLTAPGFAALGGTQAERLSAVLRGGLVIRTTLDRRTQEGANEAFAEWVPAGDRSGLGAAAVTVEPGTGAVLGMAQNREYGVSGGRGVTSVNFSVDGDVGGGTGFQTGSSFKPFTLAAWLQDGHSLQERVNATRRSFPYREFSACGKRLKGTKPYSPGNSEGHEGGRMTVLRATADSVNVAYVEMESQLDLCGVASTAESLGVHLANPEHECSPSGPAGTSLPTCLPSLTLGVKNIAPLTMAAAYAAFAAGGAYCTPYAVTSITRPGTAPGSTIAVPRPAPTCRQALPPDVASDVNTALRHVLTDGTAAGTGPVRRYESAGKTGTTDGPYDTWFVGYTAQRSTAVWVADPGGVGLPYRRVLRNITVNDRHFGTVYGASLAAPIWKALTTTSQKGLDPQPLP